MSVLFSEQGDDKLFYRDKRYLYTGFGMLDVYLVGQLRSRLFITHQPPLLFCGSVCVAIVSEDAKSHDAVRAICTATALRYKHHPWIKLN